MKLGELYDPRKNAPLVRAEVGTFTSGTITLVEDSHKTKFGECPALTIRVDSLTDDGSDHAVLLLSSPQLRQALAEAAGTEGRNSIVEGDWIKVGVVGKRETANGRVMNVWAVEYKAGDGTDTAAWG